MCKALRYEKAARRVARHHCIGENIQHKHQLVAVTTARIIVNWSKDSQKLDLYITEEGMYKLLFSSQQPMAKDFRRHCCNVIFRQIRQRLTNKTKEEHQPQILRLNEDHQQAVEEKDAALKNREYENVALQAQRDVFTKMLRHHYSS